MSPSRAALLVLVAVLLPLAGCRRATAQDPTAGALAALPAELREEGRALLAVAEPLARARELRAFAAAHPERSLEFVAAVLEEEPSAHVRQQLVRQLGYVRDPRAARALEGRIAGDADLDVVLQAVEELHEGFADHLQELLLERVLEARDGPAADLERLAAAHDHWTVMARGGVLPGFLREAPPTFAVLPAERPIRVVAFGDFGSGTAEQRATAAAMARYHGEHPFDLGITVGDNFYPAGMESPADPRWGPLWHELYDGLEIPFFPSLGNHDWGWPDSPAAEILHTGPDTSWRMPAARYTFTAGEAQFFALDTTALSAAQLHWLDRELARSTASWKVVYGHHPIRSAGQHGDDEGLVRHLLPVIQGRADVYLCGHDHDMQHLRPEGGTHFFVAGSGGAGVRPVAPGPRSLFAASNHGFAVLEVDAERLAVRFVDTALATLYEHVLAR